MIEIDGPFHRISDPGFEMLIPRWEGHDPETADQADATITLPDGTRRYATESPRVRWRLDLLRGSSPCQVSLPTPPSCAAE
ncbi:hypothetical protein, partial [Nonomuraea cavernae]|uniref:hypothetical protein n=1 Tax=Nonomuraea cavernae TaxID=2045107 RepID=UPI0033D38EF9